MCGTIFAAAVAVCGTGFARPEPRPALAERLANGPEIIGIVHWGLNTFTDREWGFGDEDPAMLNPAKFDADQIVGACKAGGIGGLVVVAKHHDGFCLWPTKTTEHNITKTPFWRGTGNDYVKEMSEACRRAGLKFGVYCSPWDRNSAHYATEKYVEIYHAQVKELLSGAYGEIFEMWFDGANGGDGWYGGANEKRKIGVAGEYYRFGDVFRFVRGLQPGAAIFASEEDDSDFRWPGNEQGLLDAGSRSTVVTTGGYADGKYMNPGYLPQINTGSPDGAFFRVCEADFPLRKGWFYHDKERGTTKSAAYLTKLYLSSVGNAGVMNIGVAPNKEGLLDADDVKALAGFKTLKDALFAHDVKPGEPFNVVVMHEDISKGEQVDEWEFVADGKSILRGKSIGLKRIRVLETPCTAKSCRLNVLKDGGSLQGVSFRLYRADPELVRLVLSATTESGETDTAKWMTAEDSGVRVERTYRPARYERGMLNQHVCQPIDEAAWIWHPDVKEPQQGCFDIGAFFMSETGAGNEARPAFVRFRRVFSSDGSPFEIDVSADERFVLFLDGKCIARGPNRGWTENWQYQTYAVSVPAGEHVMEAVVMQLGGAAPITQMSCRGGFVLKASGGYDAKLTTGKAQWQVGLLRGTTMGSEFVGHGGMGCRATSTGVGFEDELPSEWQDAVVVARPIRPSPSRFNWGLRRPGWMLYPSEMPDQTDVERRPGAFRTGPKELSSLLSGGKAVIPAGTTFTAYWDLEDYYCYYPELVMSGGKGASVRLSYAEALVDADGKKGDRSAFEGMKVDQRFHMYDTFVADGRANARFTSPWWRCGRWVVLDVSTGDEPLTLESLSIRETRYPCEMKSVFQSPDDPTFEAIQRICLRSIQNCAHETLMDCPFYEQQMYPADTRVQMLVLTALSDDDRLMRRCIDIYDLGRRDDGLVPNNWPTRNFQESQVMSLNYLMMYGDFVRWHRHDEWLKARFPGAMNTLLAMKRQENSEGLLEDVLGSPFIDWVGEWGSDPIPVGRGEGPGAIVNLYYLHAMKSVADMAYAAGEPEIAAYWRKRAGELGGRIVEKFWVADKGLMADDIGHTKFSEHAQCFAILGDVLGEAEAKAAFGHLTDGTELARVTVYSLHYLFETFAKFGRGDLILGRFGLWRDYLKAGLKTCLETPVGYKYQRSDCHGWGSHPIYHLRASIAGIRPAAPGFARVRIAPSPGNLRKIRSTMPHPSGTPVEVDLGFDGEGGVSGVVKSPVDGEFVWNGQSVPVVAGRETNVEIKGALHGGGDHVWIEAEAFSDYGKWRLDTQFTHKMGSAYLIAPGVCEPIGSASTTAILPRKGLWRVWVRTKDWLPEFSPGRFAVSVGGRQGRVLGASRKEGWVWECAGEFSLEAGPVKLSLDDLSGAFARCDALLLTTDLAYTPPSDDAALAAERDRRTGVMAEVVDSGFYDVVVVGAGPAGVNAALAAARGGVKVALIGDRPVLGGNASDEIGVNMCGAAICHAAARETGIAEEAVCVRVRHPGPGMSNSYRALVDGEKNLSVFYNERMISADADAGCVKSVVCRNTLTGVRSRFSGGLFVDATGDGWLGYFAGAEYREGREGMREFNESCAPEEPDALTMSGLLHEPGIGVCYRATKTDGPVLYETPAWAHVLPPGFERKVHDLRGQWWIEHSGLIDDCADPERARDELIRISFAYWGWLKNASSHSESARNYRLDEIPVLTGRRESRRLVGDYILTANDCLKGRVFPDAVAYGGWPIDTHDPMGMSAPKSDGYWKFHPDVPIYTIPFRCLYSKNIGNLLMAGRDISGSHMAMGSARVQQTCSVVGQAAGTAAALCIRHGLSPRELGVRKISELQQRLLRDDVYIPGFANEDPLDHAHEAVATASSSAGSYRRLSPHGRGYASAAEIVYTNASPAAVVDGVSRCVDGVAHAWVSGPGLPQWIRLDFPVAVTASEIRVTFDTNLEHRALPRPPDPALARSYAIEGSADGKAWFPVASETDNYRRLRVHRFEPRQLKSVRLVVRGTYGADQAFVNEIRVY